MTIHQLLKTKYCFKKLIISANSIIMENKKNFNFNMKMSLIGTSNPKFLFLYIKWEDKIAKQSDIEKIKQILIDQSTKLN